MPQCQCHPAGRQDAALYGSQDGCRYAWTTLCFNAWGK